NFDSILLHQIPGETRNAIGDDCYPVDDTPPMH
ncbi:unnamed protein product, partial [marine sediment metagenome]